MGRRKIEIKAIKDDRNRSVTFLKRKGGLFKKAHELSVLCSVDVAVIIFGQNKKLYEFSSGQMQEMLMKYHYYQGPHEHKGPGDFGDRGGGDDDDDDDEQMGSPGPEEQYSPPHHGVAFPNQPGMPQMRHPHPSASPPVQNGIYGPRMSTPQPQVLSRPSSRNHRRASSNLIPTHHPHAQPPQHHPMSVNYGPYHQSQGYYQAPPGAHPHPHMQMHPHQGTPPPPQQAYSHPVPPRNQMRQMYLEEQRRQSMPSNLPMPPQERPQSVPIAHHSPPQLSRPFQSPPLPGSPRLAAPVASRSHSIYTPVDDSRSILAQHWETAPRQAEVEEPSPGRADLNLRSASIDVGSAMRENRTNGDSSRPSFVPPPPLQRTRSPLSNANGSAPNSGTFPPRAPSRVNSIASDAKRPRLTVQIPSEQSDAEAATGVTASSSASPKDTTAISTAIANTTPARQAAAAGPGTSGASSAQSRSAGSVVLPPPSPSATSAGASGILSAGATGPKNPFARPLPPPPSGGPGHAPPLNTNLGGQFKDPIMETGTPMSALPSRFMSDGLLPSPSSFYPEWGFGGGGSGNNLASPAPYQPTPVKETGGGWKDEDRERERLGKRKNSEEADGDARSEKKFKG